MLRPLILLGALIAISQISLAQNTPLYFADQPTLSPDGSTIVFSYDGDLWKASASGGDASRIVAMEGEESSPKFSPDGKWLAFAGSQYGNADVFIMPVEGGTITRLTWHEAGDQPSSWAWDSKTIYFTSSRENRVATYSVSFDGGTPKRLFNHYFNTVHNLAQHPTTGAFYFNESWESYSFMHRQGYKGAYNPDLKSYNASTGEYKEHTDYEGKDFFATIDRAGKVYFLSDEGSGVYNLYLLDGDSKKRLTNFTEPVYYPSISADGRYIAFRKDYQLFLYDVASGKAKPIALNVARNSTLEQKQSFNLKGEISAFDLSGDKKKLALVSRGELFVSDVKGKFVRKLPTRPDGRVMEVHWLKDNRRIIFNQTLDGYQNWFVIAADGSSPEKTLTEDKQNNRQLSFNSDKTQAAYLSGREELRLMDMESLESKLLTKGELWGIYNDPPHFSPDDKHILYSVKDNFEGEIMLYTPASGTVQNLTNTGVTEAGQQWSPDGKYIYFMSNRTEPSYPYGLQEPDIFRMALQRYDEPYRSSGYDALFDESESESEGEGESESEGEDEGEEEEPEKKPEVLINPDGLMERLEKIGPTFGSQGLAAIVEKDDKTSVLFVSNHEEGKSLLWQTVLEPFESPKTTKIEGLSSGISAYVGVGDEHFALSRGDLYKLNLSGNKAEKVDIDQAFERSLDHEFKQMFDETWANVEVNFYDEDFHGVDWPGMRKKYSAYLPYVNQRADLRRLLNDMLGELNTSHFGFYSSGDEEDVHLGSRTLATGIRFEADKPLQVAGLVRKGPADYYEQRLRPGDVLIAVNDVKIESARNRESYFTAPSMPEELKLTFQRGEDTLQIKVHPSSYGQVNGLLYDEWEQVAQNKVDEEGDLNIAYVHMKNMGGGSLDDFLHEMVSEGFHRDALILDLRYNTGGNVHDKVLQFLSQKPYLTWKYREGGMSTQPNFAPAAKPIVLLTNEQSLSDAEMTAAGFKQLGLGTIIGTETYRWIIFTTGQSLVDGSFYRLPSWGCYTLDGDDLEKTGVAPDITVRNTFKDRLDGKDPQLEHAIAFLLQELKKAPNNIKAGATGGK